MTPRPSPALLQAVALMRAPRGARPGPEDRLPEGMEQLVRIVGGDAQALALASQCTGETEATVRDAAAFYIQQVMFATGSDSYRVLGLDAGASDEQLKSNHRWLTRWLHPDRNRDDWEAVYSERVNRAWQDLRNSERRQRYDGSRAGSAAPGAFQAGNSRSAGRPMHLEGAEPGLSLRWLPHVIFGGLGLSAVAIVALYYVLRFSEPSPELNAATTDTDRSAESSEFVHPRIAQGDLEVSSPEVPEDVSTTPAVEPVSKPPEPSPSMTLASDAPDPSATLAPDSLPTDSLPAQAPPSPAAPSALPPVARPSATTAIREPSTTAPEPSKPRLPPPMQERVALAASESAAPVERRIPAAVSAPPPQARPEARPSPQAAPVSQREANRIVGRFSEVYADGDLAGMRAMFTPDATSPDGGLDVILGEYDRLFDRSKHRLLAFQNVNWSASGNTFTIVASYEATLKTGLMARTRSQGRLRMEMRQVNDQWRIYRLEHNERTD